MKVHLLTIGDELLIGQVVDSNSAWMAQRLNEIGAEVLEITSVGDDPEHIRRTLERLFPSEADAILATGGLGPTKDDKTKQAFADFFGVGFVFHQETWERLCRLFERFGRQPTDAHRQQCLMPQNAEILSNDFGTAPAMWFEERGKVLVSLPGVPHEMKQLMEAEVLPRLRARFPGKVILHRTILTVGEGESRIAQRLSAIEEGLPPALKLAYLPGLGQVRLRLSATGEDESQLRTLLEEHAAAIERALPGIVFGYEDTTLEEAIGNLLRERRLTLATAESCTGGYLAHRITTVSGSSDYFTGSVVAYSNAVKQKVLGVRESTLRRYGAVSEATVREMVQGVRKALGADAAIATSGIAGPTGGTPEKPVGTIWIAAGCGEELHTRKLQLGTDRLLNIQLTGVFALDLLRKILLQTPPA